MTDDRTLAQHNLTREEYDLIVRLIDQTAAPYAHPDP